MYTKDITADSGINVTAEVTEHSAKLFQRMCKMCAANAKFVSELSKLELDSNRVSP